MEISRDILSNIYKYLSLEDLSNLGRDTYIDNLIVEKLDSIQNYYPDIYTDLNCLIELESEIRDLISKIYPFVDNQYILRNRDGINLYTQLGYKGNNDSETNPTYLYLHFIIIGDMNRFIEYMQNIDIDIDYRISSIFISDNIGLIEDINDIISDLEDIKILTVKIDIVYNCNLRSATFNAQDIYIYILKEYFSIIREGFYDIEVSERFYGFIEELALYKLI